MRKILDLIILFFIFGFLLLQKDKVLANFNYLLLGPCDRPITYHLGEVDSGYGLTKEQFLGKIERANEIWSGVVKKNLFSEDPNGQLTINLIYSERQAAMDKLSREENNLSQNKQSLDQAIASYKQQQLVFEKKLADFNSEVSKWNSQGGAPESVFENLKKQQDELKQEAERLNNLASQLNQTVKNYNIGVGNFNQNAQNYNALVNQKPEAGLFRGSVPEIDIYLTRSDTELIHTLAHEMGHAMSLDHIDDPNSIMYPYTNEITVPDSLEKEKLINRCQQKNWEIVLIRLEGNLREKIQNLEQMTTHRPSG